MRCVVASILCILACGLSCRHEDFHRRVERRTLETIQKQIQETGAYRSRRQLSASEIQQLSGTLTAELRSAGWEVQSRVLPDQQSAAREMARYIALVAAAYQPGTMSHVGVGQARYFYRSEGIVFLRQNALVWIRERDYPARVWPPADQMARECEEIAATVDGKMLQLLEH